MIDGKDEAGSTEDPRAEVWTRLLAWYQREGRATLPWRHTRDPYAILVSEVMLQQTQVDRVVARYQRFLERFPSLRALADAPVADVIREWSGLGYNLRAVRLWDIARQAVADFGGELPARLEDLLQLRGVGRYTAGALACFAFAQPVATVDTNIRRVLWRVFRGVEPDTWPGGQRATDALLALAAWALPPDRAYDWQQALMDLGATVCLARRPRCEACPLATKCQALAQAATVSLFPSGGDVARLRQQQRDEVMAPPTQVAERTEDYHTRRQRAPVPFTQTARYFRGRIIDALRALPSGESLPLTALGRAIRSDYSPDDEPWLRSLIQRLERDGLLRVLRDEGASGEAVALPCG